MYNIVPHYEPGDPYEFIGPDPFNLVKIHRMYHCFRDGCKGRAVRVADRNTHNQFHNGTSKSDAGLDYWDDDDYEYEWEF